MSYVIKKKLITGHNRPGTALRPIGLVVHCTATPGATAEAERSYFQNTTRDASVHAFVDWDSIVQTIPWNEKAWHAGGTANNRFIGIELCEPSTKNAVQFNEVWKRAVWLFAYLFVNVIKAGKVTADNLMSHEEVSRRWRQTDHTDPVAYFAQYGRTVNDFRAAVQAEISKMIGGDCVDRLIIAYGDGDVPAATIAMFKYRCGMILREIFEYNKEGNKADIYFVIGGPENYDPGVEGATVYHLSGPDRVRTALKALS